MQQGRALACFSFFFASASSPAAPSAYALAWCLSGFGACEPNELAAVFALFCLSSFQLFLCDELASHVIQRQGGQLKVGGDREPGELKSKRGK